MSVPVSPNAKNRLLAEGRDDLHSVINLLRRNGIDYDLPTPEMPYLHATDGYPDLLKTIAVAAKTYGRLGILVDADASPSSRWSAICSPLNSLGIMTSTRPDPDGTILSGLLPNSKIGIWLMPNNVDPGMLESFLTLLIPSGDPCYSHAVEATAGAKVLGAPFSETHSDKARIHTWLSWREQPGMPFGTAITASCFRTDCDLALNFVSWYRRLFF